MTKERVDTLKEALGCKRDNGLIRVYGFNYQTLSNWRKGTIYKTTEVLLDLVVKQHKLLSEEQKEEIVEKMTAEYFSKNMDW